MTDVSIAGKIGSYYALIDNLEIPRVTALFARDAVYKRAERTMNGLGEIESFFQNERLIRGKHILDSLWSDDSRGVVFVTGLFDGHGAEGDSRQVEFADVWRFNDEGLVSSRRTFLSLGQAYVLK